MTDLSATYMFCAFSCALCLYFQACLFVSDTFFHQYYLFASQRAQLKDTKRQNDMQNNHKKTQNNHKQIQNNYTDMQNN